MNTYEIVLAVICFIFPLLLIWTIDYFKDKIKKLEDKIEILDDKIERLCMLNGGNDGKLARSENDFGTLIDGMRKERYYE
jgi:hypothetical protein